MTQDEKWMKKAWMQAKVAAKKGEVPVGAVVVKDGRIIARAHNLRESAKDPTAHAEILAMRRAAKKLGGWRLTGCELYVTLEPCPMCAGAVINARLDAVYFGAFDPKAGAFGSRVNLNEVGLNHKTKIVGGVLERDCADILSEYFSNKRRLQRMSRRERRDTSGS